MTASEMSNEFDTLLNSYSLRTEFGLTDPLVVDEYEKSVFLTQAQEQIVIQIYTGKFSGDGFEKTEEIRRYMSNLVKTYVTSEKKTGHLGLSKSSMFFEIPDDVWFITYESAILQDERLGCLNGQEAIIVPVTQDEYYRIVKNPFRGPAKGRALRLDNANNIIEIVSDYNIDRYLIRYLAKPTPIVLVDLDDISIDGVKVVTECKLDEVLHRYILEDAVKLAIRSKAPLANQR